MPRRTEEDNQLQAYYRFFFYYILDFFFKHILEFFFYVFSSNNIMSNRNMKNFTDSNNFKVCYKNKLIDIG